VHAPRRAVSRGRVLPRGCCSLVATARAMRGRAMRDVPCQLDARQVRVVRGHQRAAAVRARPGLTSNHVRLVSHAPQPQSPRHTC
jgi:hypothetical protein